ncbi:sigma-70 family RNA polymerase sigma factor [Olivibacter ginsenosidimutans]|uniref:Sigma-70 family RNA polymerase sigma factor n=1 Tax=Olivibacter ginsenosidimutans TaxID=1176537 RepID=A0ABP9BZD7_9SPHI
MYEHNALLPNLFRTEYQKLVAVLSYRFGIQHLAIAEDIVSDTFLAATEDWSLKGIPQNPTAWLYTVAKNKARNYFKRNTLFEQKVSPEFRYTNAQAEETMEIDLSTKHIADSQLAMIFTVCHPSISKESQVALALNLLCGFGIQEIADAFLTNKEVIYKRINRAKEKLREMAIRIEQPNATQIADRLDIVLTTLYLLFSEGYYSASQDRTLRQDLCTEAIRLTYLLVENPNTNQPAVNALLALMCFHSSRFDARTNENGEIILYANQDESQWNQQLIEQGKYYLNKAATGDELTKYHLEAGIAFWHTQKEDLKEKWENILQLYDHLIKLTYSPIIAMNRAFALSKVYGNEKAIAVAEALKLTDNHFYYTLLGNLYAGIDKQKAYAHFQTALQLAHSENDKVLIQKNMEALV